ncbi:PhnB protein [Pseudosulfitobacter pseudonitzschiae]|uniref:Glyoxalase/bleomycin resistance protein/dioxygenase n=1 Tax=Pseudosulfitobacter pseudonitzschiae TaxID=1402135 RepID=A0A073J6B4_9RHOB|nr:VOC family protein [Pseudosulfitobacter pseudonitzschiae]KEJ97474.1 glyoxalase/bleomycin resistance protein/dioxygenase [Pseudosulfitobacter pseudonitzschiae]QKS08762.1 VOC family protein [Pseudosulfitobacter pseudonitzschiae]SHE69518.1 PhnB protein [Pseudosulfitobacter pseudonitzschiae]
MEPEIYLFFKGNCLEAMRHYAKVLGGEITGVFRNADAPTPESRMPGGDDMVMNMAMKLGNALVLASDNSEDMYDKPQGFRVSISPKSLAEFDRIYDALAKDAERIEMEPDETFWAERFAMFTDKYGTPWMLMFAGSKAQGSSS